jgi:hypothetical protein
MILFGVVVGRRCPRAYQNRGMETVTLRADSGVNRTSFTLHNLGVWQPVTVRLLYITRFSARLEEPTMRNEEENVQNREAH